MKAIRVHEFGPPEVMKLEETAEPQPGRGEVVVRLRAIGVNPVETYVRSGVYPRLPQLPYTPGSDGAGELLDTGERVYLAGSLSGTYAELALCRADQVHPLPPQVSFEQGAALGVPYATAYRALYRARAKRGETVLIHGGSGAVGLAAIQLGKHLGLRVLATAGTPEGCELVLKQGAERCFNHHDPTYENEIQPDVILEMLANVNLDRDLRMLAMRGRVVVIGNRGRIEIDPRLTMSKDLEILGISLANVTPEDLVDIHEALGDGLEDGCLQPVIDRRFPLEQAAQAHHTVMEAGSAGKIVLIPE